ncbi:heterodisulfide reductase-related iron-sulfur binding cluster [Mesorhizobium shangrilense]|uniref:Heterodisulfide reductase-related iron-sulfur binding cluster n=1 Tax=Mesorhizobium shangrilense TaxID=460060 RepID=A0ABV2DMN4_9HYPH
METRELFWSLSKLEIAVFYVFGITAIFLFLLGLWHDFAKYRGASGAVGRVRLRPGFLRLVRDLLSHKKVARRDRLAGIAHAAIFWGFVIALMGTTIIFIDHDFVQPIFGFSLWKGDFYLIFSLLLDLGGFALLIGLIAMSWRRWVIQPAKLDYTRPYSNTKALRSVQAGWRWEDRVFILVLMVITISGFLLEGLRLYTDRPAWADWSPIGYTVAGVYAAAGLSPEAANSLRLWGWWSHGILALAFIATIPWYKAKHVIAVLGSLLLRDTAPLKRLPNEPDVSDTVGIARLSDFDLKDMLDFDACTKCGRCHEACPAAASGYPLSPRDLILDLRTANGSAADGQTLVEMVIKEETLWSCMSCGACQEICPVGIEHPSKIVRMRRSLVDQGKIEPLLQTAFTSLGNFGNSFGEPPRKRSAWVDELDFPVKDIRKEPADYLWFVGDYASFDPRNQIVSRTVARLLRVANVDFALLHEGEHSAGNDIRRAGEEGLYSMLAEHNLGQMKNAHPFSRIITTDPHSYNTIRNEYPEFQDVAEIEHYSTALAELLRTGGLKVTKPLNRRVTFHDPCHLGRLNGGYDAPREVLELIGCEIVEMPRNRDNSFCCGAGGGRIWMAGKLGEKPSENRMHEAAALTEIDCFVTCCPKDLNMFEDANKTSDHVGSFTVNDLAELVAEAIELEKLSGDDLPDLVERIVNRSSQIVASAVLELLKDGLSKQWPTLDQVTPRINAQAAPAMMPVDPLAAATSVGDTSSDVGIVSEVAPPPSEPVPKRQVAVKKLRAMDWEQLAPVEAAKLPAYEMPEKSKHKILVAVRHVGVLNEDFEITSDGLGVSSGSFDHKINEWDEAAMEEALLLSEKLGECEIVVVTIGDEGAETSLRKALAMGADRGVRIWDDGLIDADPMTIARGLAGIAEMERPDLILCGVQSADFGHGSTGTILAGILGLPHSASVVGCDWDGASRLTLTRELEGGTQHRFHLSVPAVLTIQTGANQPRYATMRMIKQARQRPIQLVDGASLDDGSRGFVVDHVYKPVTEQATMLPGSVDEVAAFIIEKVKNVGGR